MGFTVTPDTMHTQDGQPVLVNRYKGFTRLLARHLSWAEIMDFAAKNNLDIVSQEEIYPTRDPTMYSPNLSKIEFERRQLEAQYELNALRERQYDQQKEEYTKKEREAAEKKAAEIEAGRSTDLRRRRSIRVGFLHARKRENS